MFNKTQYEYVALGMAAVTLAGLAFANRDLVGMNA